jgi:uridine kinase
MQILLKLRPDATPIPIEMKDGATYEMLAEKVADELPYPVYAAKRNNVVERLTEPLQQNSIVELLDLRNRSAELVYQNSVSLLYIKAVQDVLGKVPVVIEHSLNKGVYTEIKTSCTINERQLNIIRKRMDQLVKMDLPLVRNLVNRDVALGLLRERNMQEKIRILESSPQLEQVKFYSLGDLKDFFYATMVPSTRYLNLYEIRKYKRGILLRFPQASAPDRIPPYVDDKKMSEAFAEASRWQDLLGISYVCDLNEKINSNSIKEVIQLSEALHEKRVVEVAYQVAKEGKRIILISGPSSSGKTTFARKLRIQLQVRGLHPLYLGTDDYFVERTQTPMDEFGQPNYEDLDALDVRLFNQDMNDLLAGKETDLPTFDFLVGQKKFGTRKTVLAPGDPIIIEGIHALNPALTPFVPEEEKFRIYISPLTQLNIDDHNRIPTTDSRMLRRLVRDHQYRGKSAQLTIKEWSKVRAGEDKNIFPYNSQADVFFNSVHIYELAVLKKYAEPLLASITQEEPEYSEAARMLRFLNFFNIVEDDSVISNTSIIREFIGGSVFVD